MRIIINGLYFICYNSFMQGRQQIKNPRQRISEVQPLKKSNFLTQLQRERKERLSNLQASRRQLSFSTFLDIPNDTLEKNFSKKHARKETDNLQQTDDELKRARSLKTLPIHKPIIENVDKHPQLEINENVLRVKMEQMTFKFKNKIGSLLKQLGTSTNELNRFANFEKIDDILNLLSEKVREKLVQTQLNEANFHKARSKQKYTINGHEAQLDSLRKKLQDKQLIQKSLKNKVRDSHLESRQLYDKLNNKQKDLSAKITQLYQLKTSFKQRQKNLQNLQFRYEMLQKQKNEYRKQLQSDSKDILNSNVQLKQQNNLLNQRIQQLLEQIQQLMDKNTILITRNMQLTEELTRWRERFEDASFIESEKEKEKEKLSQSNTQFVQVVVVPTNQLKKSTMSMHNFYFDRSDNNPRQLSLTSLQIENMRLTTKVQELERQNKRISREILNYATIKQRYQQTLIKVGEKKVNFQQGLDQSRIQFFKQQSVDLYQIQLETHYKKKMEDIVKQWKEKLYDIVHKYEDEIQVCQQKMDELIKEKVILQKKIFAMANQRYEIENKLIQKEKEVYQLKKYSQNNSSFGKVESTKDPKSSSILSDLSIKQQQQSQGQNIQAIDFQSKQLSKGSSKQQVI